MDIDIDDVVYPLLLASFPDNEPWEILDVVEELKQPRGVDRFCEFEQEVWQKYLALRAGAGEDSRAARRSRSLPA